MNNSKVYSGNINRICFYGAPGVGKSTVAAHIFSKLKEKNLKCELVTKYVKNWAYIKREPKDWDQLFLFSQQLQKEYHPLLNNNLVVTDAPLYLSAFYAYYNSCSCESEIFNLAGKFEKQFRGLHIVLLDDFNDYDEDGRFHDLLEAKGIQNSISIFMRNLFFPIPYQYYYLENVHYIRNKNVFFRKSIKLINKYIKKGCISNV